MDEAASPRALGHAPLGFPESAVGERAHAWSPIGSAKSSSNAGVRPQSGGSLTPSTPGGKSNRRVSRTKMGTNSSAGLRPASAPIGGHLAGSHSHHQVSTPWETNSDRDLKEVNPSRLGPAAAEEIHARSLEWKKLTAGVSSGQLSAADKAELIQELIEQGSWFQEEVSHAQVQVRAAKQAAALAEARAEALAVEMAETKSRLASYQALKYLPEAADPQGLRNRLTELEADIRRFDITVSHAVFANTASVENNPLLGGGLVLPKSARSTDSSGSLTSSDSSSSSDTASKDKKSLVPSALAPTPRTQVHHLVEAHFRRLEDLVFVLKKRVLKLEENEGLAQVVSRFGTVRELLAENSRLNKETALLRMREIRYESSILLSRSDLHNADAPYLRMLVLALQNELGLHQDALTALTKDEKRNKEPTLVSHRSSSGGRSTRVTASRNLVGQVPPLVPDGPMSPRRIAQINAQALPISEETRELLASMSDFDPTGPMAEQSKPLSRSSSAGSAGQFEQLALPTMHVELSNSVSKAVLANELRTARDRIAALEHDLEQATTVIGSSLHHTARTRAAPGSSLRVPGRGARGSGVNTRRDMQRVHEQLVLRVAELETANAEKNRMLEQHTILFMEAGARATASQEAAAKLVTQLRRQLHTSLSMKKALTQAQSREHAALCLAQSFALAATAESSRIPDRELAKLHENLLTQFMTVVRATVAIQSWWKGCLVRAKLPAKFRRRTRPQLTSTVQTAQTSTPDAPLSPAISGPRIEVDSPMNSPKTGNKTLVASRRSSIRSRRVQLSRLGGSSNRLSASQAASAASVAPPPAAANGKYEVPTSVWMTLSSLLIRDMSRERTALMTTAIMASVKDQLKEEVSTKVHADLTAARAAMASDAEQLMQGIARWVHRPRRAASTQTKPARTRNAGTVTSKHDASESNKLSEAASLAVPVFGTSTHGPGSHAETSTSKSGPDRKSGEFSLGGLRRKVGSMVGGAMGNRKMSSRQGINH